MRTCFLMVAVTLVPSGVLAAGVEARWDPVLVDVEGKPESISHYILYYDTRPRPPATTHPSDESFLYQGSINAGNETRVTVRDLQEGRTYYFSVVAVDTGGNISAYSPEVMLALPSAGNGGTLDSVEGQKPASPALDNGQGQKPGGGCACAGTGIGPGLWWLILLALAALAEPRRQP